MEENKEKGISLSDIFRVVWKNIILIAIVTVAITAIGMIYTLAIVKPTYKASSKVIVAVETQGTTGTSVETTNTLRITETIAELVETRAVMVPVAKKLGATTEEEINNYVAALNQITSESYSTTNYIVGITVVASNPEKAVEYVNYIAESLTEYANTDTALAKFGIKLNIVDSAVKGSYNSPNKTLYVLVSFVLGVVVSFVIVFIKEFMSSKFKTRDEIIDATNGNLIGTFYDKNRKEKTENAIFYPQNIQNLEPFNNLYTNIRFANVDNPYKVIEITSSVENELKSTILVNLANAIALNSKKVIIIDLDLRKPAIHNAFGLSKENGIVDYVSGNIDLASAIKATDKNVDVITAGSDVINPYSIIDSLKLKELVEELKTKYDYVFIDTPPLSVCGDALNTSKIVDGVLYNVAVDQVKKKLFTECVGKLNEVDANIIGYNATKVKLTRGEKNAYYFTAKYYSSK